MTYKRTYATDDLSLVVTKTSEETAASVVWTSQVKDVDESQLKKMGKIMSEKYGFCSMVFYQGTYNRPLMSNPQEVTLIYELKLYKVKIWPQFTFYNGDCDDEAK